MSRARVGMAVIALACLAVLGLRMAGSQRQHVTDRAHRPAAAAQQPRVSATCREIAPTWVPKDLVRTDRRLVPFSRSVSGIEGEWEPVDPSDRSTGRTAAGRASDERSITVVDGGFVDDILEAYDGLTAQEPMQVDGQPASILVADFLDREVRVAYWHDPEARSPCDVHAVVGVGLTPREFTRVLASAR